MTAAVLIIVVTWNGRDDTLACLESLRALHYQHAQTLVVDNGSSDDSVATIHRSFPEVKILETGANLGFTGGNNAGLRYALERGFDYVLLLNNDTIVAPDLLDHLIGAIDHDPRIGIVGPLIFYHRQPDVIWSAGGTIDWRNGTTAMRGLDQRDVGQFDRMADVDFVTGCALLIRRSAIECAGLLDERFFMYYEETEWCVRVARHGYRIVFVPRARLWHKIAPEQQHVSPRIVYYMTRNRLLFLRLTHATPLAWLRAILLQDARTILSLSIRPKWRGQRSRRWAITRGWIDFWRAGFGPSA